MIKRWIMRNSAVKFIYRAKFYLDVSIAQISWITAKFPEAMAVVYLVEKFTDYVFTWQTALSLAIAGALTLTIAGKIWHACGFYHTEKFIHAEKDPVQAKLLQAANIIIKEGKKCQKKK